MARRSSTWTWAVLLAAQAVGGSAFAPISVGRRTHPSSGLAAKKKRPTRGGKGRSSASAGAKGFGRQEPSSPQPSPSVTAEIKVENSTTASSSVHADLLSWLQSDPNTYLSPKFAILPSTLGGYGGFATSPLERGELILKIPRECCVTFDDALADPLCGDDFRRIKEQRVNSWGMILIAGWIAKERLLMKEYSKCATDTNDRQRGRRKHEAYLNSVPWERGELGQEHVLFWSDDEIEGLLGGSLAYEDALRIRRTVDEATSLLGEFVVPIVQRVTENLRGEGLASLDEEEDGILEELERTVKGAFVVALSRSFAEEVEDDDGTVEVENALLPLIDILQHSNEPNTMLESYDDCILLRARRDVAAGEEMFHQYQEEDSDVIPPHKFFTRYGFVPGAREPVAELLRERSPLFFAR